MSAMGRFVRGRFRWKSDIVRRCGLEHIRSMRAVLACALTLLISSSCSSREAASCGGMPVGWTATGRGRPVEIVANQVSIHHRQTRWNNVIVDERRLTDLLRQTAAAAPRPALLFSPDPSDCEFSAYIMALIVRAYPCREGYCWLGPRWTYG